MVGADNSVKQGAKDFLWSSLFLLLALSLAILSSIARKNGLFLAAVFFSGIALLVAVVVCFAFVPKLLSRVKADYWPAFRLFRVTRRGAFFIFLVTLIALATFNSGNNLLVLVLSFLLAALLVSGMVSNLVLYGLKVSLNLPKTIHAGQRAVLLLTLHNFKKFSPSFALNLRGTHKEGESEATSFFSTETQIPYVERGGTVSVRVECEFHKRGVYPVKGFEVKTGFPFGFFTRGREVDADGKFTVYPRLVELNGFFRKYPFLQGPEVMNRKGMGSGLYNIRDYERGDDARYVHWKSSAKLSRLMVKEFVQEKEDFVHLIFSTYLTKQDEISVGQFEKALSYIATLAYHYRARNRELRFNSGEFEVLMDSSETAFEILMDYLAWVQPSEELLIRPSHILPNSIVFTAGDSFDLRGVPQVDYLRL